MLKDLLARRDYRGASALAQQLGTSVQDEVADIAAAHWLDVAERACRHGERGAMNKALAEATRYHRPANAPQFREARRRIRLVGIELTIAPHWTALLHASAAQRQHYFGAEPLPAPSTYLTFLNLRLLQASGVDPGQLDALETLKLENARQALVDVYPASLAPALAALDDRFMLAALRVAGGRPDLAVLDLVELPDTNPVVCLERARVAHALGFPGTAVLALSDFLLQHKEHVTFRRLHTGVFMAQMAHASGNADLAIRILEGLPLGELGRRPVLLLAELLDEAGRPAEAAQILERWSPDEP